MSGAYQSLAHAITTGPIALDSMEQALYACRERIAGQDGIPEPAEVQLISERGAHA